MTKDDSQVGCGISSIWMTSNNDIFFPACEFHDSAYEKDSFLQKKFTRAAIDKMFLNQMLVIAEENILLKARAYLYYYIVRIFGGKYWEGKT